MDDASDTLPSMYVTVKCEHCFTDLEYEEGYYCPNCRVKWGENPFDDTPGQFIDTEERPCGEEPEEQPRTGAVKGTPFTATPRPCTLPASHTSKHYFDVHYEFGKAL